MMAADSVPMRIVAVARKVAVRRVVLVATALSVLACSRTDPGISREKAAAVLKAYDYTEIELQAAPDGWTGTAIPASGGYRMRVTVDRNGLMQLQPCACGGKAPAG
jgi:hypothetical protein